MAVALSVGLALYYYGDNSSHHQTALFKNRGKHGDKDYKKGAHLRENLDNSSDADDIVHTEFLVNTAADKCNGCWH